MDSRRAQLALLDEYVRIPTVSRHVGPDALQAVIDFWKAQGLALTTLYPPDGQGTPSLWGEIPGPPGAPTLLIYGHFDTQPAGDLDKWVWEGVQTAPFLATYFHDGRQVADPAIASIEQLDDTVMIARGTVDNKGQHVAALVAALAAARQGTLLWRVRILLEGEEESGSTHFAEIVEAHRERLQADLCISADGPKLRNRPTLVLGIRGILHVHLSAENGQKTGVHSGNYGNVVPNPLFALARLVEDVRVQVNDYARQHDTFRQETEQLAHLWEGERWRHFLWPAVNAYHFATEGTSLDVRRLVIPRAAHAKLDIRLTPDTPPQAISQLVENLVARHAQSAEAKGITLQLRLADGKPSSFTSARRPEFAWLLRLLEAQGDGAPVTVPILGGTLPTWVITDILAVPTIILPCANCDNQQHDANEHYVLRHYFAQFRLFEQIYTSLPNAEKAADGINGPAQATESLAP